MNTMKTLMLLALVIVSILVLCTDVFTSVAEMLDKLEEDSPLSGLAEIFGFLAEVGNSSAKADTNAGQ